MVLAALSTDSSNSNSRASKGPRIEGSSEAAGLITSMSALDTGMISILLMCGLSLGDAPHASFSIIPPLVTAIGAFSCMEGLWANLPQSLVEDIARGVSCNPQNN